VFYVVGVGALLSALPLLFVASPTPPAPEAHVEGEAGSFALSKQAKVGLRVRVRVCVRVCVCVCALCVYVCGGEGCHGVLLNVLASFLASGRFALFVQANVDNGCTHALTVPALVRAVLAGQSVC